MSLLDVTGEADFVGGHWNLNPHQRGDITRKIPLFSSRLINSSACFGAIFLQLPCGWSIFK